MVSNPETKCKLLTMIIEYALNGNEPTKGDLAGLDDVGRIYWTTVFPSIRNSRKNYVNGCKSKGAPLGSRNAAKFEIPTLKEVIAYFKNKQFASDGELFFDYNEQTGWESAKRHFKNWRAVADRWEERGGEYDA